MKSKGRPKGPQKVVFKRRVLPSTVPKLDRFIQEEESLGHAAPGEKIRECIERPLPVPVEAFKSPFPTNPTPPVQNVPTSKETPKRPPLKLTEEQAVVVRPNFFKK